MKDLFDQRLRASVTGLILAAGRSQRMGAFKPLLPFGHTTVIDSCVNNLTAGGIKNIVVVLGHRADELGQHLKNSPVKLAFNSDPDRGMSSSIECGIRALPPQSAAVMITPVDHPAVAGEIVAQLLGQWVSGDDLVKPTWQGHGGHPVIVDLRFSAELLRLDANLGLKQLFHEHLSDVKRLPVKSSYIARDMDTWEDYAALHRDVFGFPPPIAPMRSNGKVFDNLNE